MVIKKAKESAKKFNREVKKSIGSAIVAAFGLVIALSWKDVINSYVEKISSFSNIEGVLITAFFVTILSVIGIIVVARLTKETELEKK